MRDSLSCCGVRFLVMEVSCVDGIERLISGEKLGASHFHRHQQ